MTNLNYKIIGEGEPILFLHGFMGSSNDWINIANSLNAKSILVDLPGHGKSINLDYYEMEFENVVNEIRKIISQKINGKVNIVSYSMGSRFAIALACKFPELVDKLVIESGTAGIQDPEERETRKENDKVLAQKIRSSELEDFLDDWYNLLLWGNIKTNPNYNQMISSRLKNNKEEIARSLELMGTGNQKSYWDEMKNFNSEVLFITGEDDKKYSGIGTKMNDLNPKIKLKIIKDAAHNVHFEKEDIFIQLIKDFIGE